MGSKLLKYTLFLTACAGVAIGFAWIRDHFRLPPVSSVFSSSPMKSDVGGSMSNLFVADYPREEKFRDELALLRKQGRLKQENESLIQSTIVSASDKLNMPPAVLWCLLFQESRLDHLVGIDGDSGARGLGQFSHFSFFEINHHLDRFDPDNRSLMMELLGRDIRPVQPRRDLKHPSSYYYIPTAVITSAAFLNNRHHQLRRVLEKKGLVYDPNLLWMYAAMAYNKGGRSVISLWNDTRRRGGNRHVEKLVLEPPTFLSTMSDQASLQRALRRIWPSGMAREYAKELRIHMQNLRDCALRNDLVAKVEERPQ